MTAENIYDSNILSKALDIFSHYGYKKTTLDEIAGAVGFSRQTIYQKYKSKKDLFIMAVNYLLDESLNSIDMVFRDNNLSIEEKLVKACDLWGGYYVRSVKNSPHIDEIITVTNDYVGDIYASKLEEFINKVSAVLTKSGVEKRYKKKGITSGDLSNMLHYTVKGIMHLCDSYESFLKDIELAVKVICTE